MLAFVNCQYYCWCGISDLKAFLDIENITVPLSVYMSLITLVKNRFIEI
jgi:hypothetical protein